MNDEAWIRLKKTKSMFLYQKQKYLLMLPPLDKILKWQKKFLWHSVIFNIYSMVHEIKNGNSFKFLATMQQILSNKCQKNFDHFELYLHVPTFISKEEKLIKTSANFYLNKALFIYTTLEMDYYSTILIILWLRIKNSDHFIKLKIVVECRNW